MELVQKQKVILLKKTKKEKLSFVIRWQRKYSKIYMWLMIYSFINSGTN